MFVVNKTFEPIMPTLRQSTSIATTLPFPVLFGHGRAAACPRQFASGSPSSAHFGFTILELMVAIAVAAMLAAIAAPGMMDFVRNGRLSTAARQFDADVLLARREAIKRNTRVLVCPVGATANKCGSGTAWAPGWLVCYDANLDGDCDDTVTGNPNPIRKHGALDASLTLTGPATVARFNANGTQGAAGAASLTFTTQGTWTGSKSFIEKITATGNVSMVGG